MTNAISGPILKKQLANYDLESSSWKTLEDISPSDLKKFSKSLPKSGMTQRGQLFELVMSEPRIDVSESLSSPTLNVPTPTASDSHWDMTKAERKGIKGNHNLSLTSWARLLPTPMARDYKGASGRDMDLTKATRLLPTPTVTHVRNHDESIEEFNRRELASSTGQIGKSTGLAVRLLPTPTTQEGSGQCRDYRSDLTHPFKCVCKIYRIHWIQTEG